MKLRKRSNIDNINEQNKDKQQKILSGEDELEINKTKKYENSMEEDKRIEEESEEEESEEEESEEEESEEEESDEENSDEENSDEEDIIKYELEKLKEVDPEIHNKFIAVQEEIQKSEPSVKELLTIPLRIEDRAKLSQHFNIYKSQIPYTNEWLEARSRYNHMLKEYKIGYKQYMQFSEEEHTKMQEEEKKLISFDAQLALKYKILGLNTSYENKSIIYRKYEELSSLDSSNDEYGKLKHWLKWVTDIPHDNIEEKKVDNITEFIKKASKKLDKELFGMKKIKEQILLFLSAKIMNPNMKRSNLGLVGPPGCGKTAIARLIAELLESGFEQISFGGIDKADFLKGHDYTYIGAQPGAIVKALKRLKYKNGIIFLDELDKAAEHPDISAALLHLVDQSQNYDFKDNFLGEISIDLSHIWYIASMNKIPSDEALADRWWIIEVNGYTNKDKIQIINKYLLPKALKNANFDMESIKFNENSLQYFINKITNKNDKGVRTIQKAISDLINKIYFIITHQDEEGKLPFLTSFKVDKKLTLPLVLNNILIDNLIENKELSTVLNLMYI
jgi:ATP-dependent Lon protease